MLNDLELPDRHDALVFTGCDLGLRTGACRIVYPRGLASRPVVTVHEIDLRKDRERAGEVAFFGLWADHLRHFLTVEGLPVAMAFERVHARSGNSSKFIEPQRGILSVISRDLDAELTGVPVSTLKKFATGSGRASKADMAEALREQWRTDEFPTQTHRPRRDLTDNEVDATWAARFVAAKYAAALAMLKELHADV